jgi:DNA-binding CsgD family transcriptional regulator
MTVVDRGKQQRAGEFAGSFAWGPAGAILRGMATRPSSATFVGRSEELARLAEARDRAAGGAPTVVVVGGEAGVGKSRLLRRFADDSSALGATVLVGGCVELGGEGVPFAPIVEALRTFVRGVDAAELERWLGPARAELARLLPELGPVPTGAQGGELDLWSVQGRLFELMLGLLERLAAERTVMLMIEDLHWADRSTRDLLAYLIGNLRQGRLALILTYRSDELHRRHPLRPFLAELERGRVERLELERFARDEVAAQLTGILGAPPPAGLAERIHVRSGGNAFFVEELAAAAGKDQELPRSLRDTLLARIELLPEPTQQVLRAASAAGGQVGHDLLAAVAELPEPGLLEALREAVSTYVLVADAGDRGYGFRHALVKEAVYAELLPGERGRLHGRFAAALAAWAAQGAADGPGRAAELAWHWYAAHDLERALPAAVEAGLAAERAYAFAEAQRHFERALELWDQVPAEVDRRIDRLQLLGRAAEAAANVGSIDRAIALVRAALAEVDPERDPRRAGLLTSRLAHHLRIAGRPGAFEAYQEAVRLVPPTPPTVERANVLAAFGQALMLRASMAEALTVCEEAIPVARASGARSVEPHLLNTRGVAVYWLGDPEGGLSDLRRARRLAAEAGALREEVRACINLSDVLGELDRLEEAVATAMEGMEVARRSGLQRTNGVFLASNAASSLFELGRWDEVDLVTAAAAASSAAEDVNALALHGVRAQLEAGRGNFRAALDHVQAARSFGGDVFVAAQYTAGLCATEAEVAAWEGRHDDARAAVVAGLASSQAVGSERNSDALRAVGLRVEGDRVEQARTRQDDAAVRDARRVATELLRQVRSGHGAPSVPWRRASIATCEAEWTRAQGSSDPERWEAAAAAWEAVAHHPYHAAYARWRAAEALLARRGDRDRAGRLLRQAHAATVSLGAEPLRREAERLARLGRIQLAPTAAGGRTAPAAPGADGADLGLTARELEVLRLVAEGCSNRQVAEALFISAKTASVHVSNILAKLGVASRVEAAAVAHRLGLVADEQARPTRAGRA